MEAQGLQKPFFLENRRNWEKSWRIIAAVCLTQCWRAAREVVYTYASLCEGAVRLGGGSWAVLSRDLGNQRALVVLVGHPLITHQLPSIRLVARSERSHALGHGILLTFLQTIVGSKATGKIGLRIASFTSSTTGA